MSSKVYYDYNINNIYGHLKGVNILNEIININEKVSVSKASFESDFSNEVRTFKKPKLAFEMAHSSNCLSSFSTKKVVPNIPELNFFIIL